MVELYDLCDLRLFASLLLAGRWMSRGRWWQGWPTSPRPFVLLYYSVRYWLQTRDSLEMRVAVGLSLVFRLFFLFAWFYQQRMCVSRPFTGLWLMGEWLSIPRAIGQSPKLHEKEDWLVLGLSESPWEANSWSSWAVGIGEQLPVLSSRERSL